MQAYDLGLHAAHCLNILIYFKLLAWPTNSGDNSEGSLQQCHRFEVKQEKIGKELVI